MNEKTTQSSNTPRQTGPSQRGPSSPGPGQKSSGQQESQRPESQRPESQRPGPEPQRPELHRTPPTNHTPAGVKTTAEHTTAPSELDPIAAEPEAPTPPLLYDVIFTGEQVRQADGPWLGEAAPTHTAAASEPHLPAPPPPSIRALWEGDAQLREEAIASIPPTVRHEIEQRAQRALLQELRSELAQRLPAVLQQNQHVLRHTVDEALRAALRQAPQKTTVTQTTQTAQTAQTTQTVADTDTDTVKQRQQQHSSSDPLTQTRGLDGEDVRPERH